MPGDRELPALRAILCMPQFAGFPSGKVRSTPVPAPFFTELLPQIDHLGEMKVTLYALWFLDQQEGKIRYLAAMISPSDRKLLSGGCEPYPDEARQAAWKMPWRAPSAVAHCSEGRSPPRDGQPRLCISSIQPAAALRSKPSKMASGSPDLGMRASRSVRVGTAQYLPPV